MGERGGAGGGLLYVLGTVLMSQSTTGAELALTGGVLLGLGTPDSHGKATVAEFAGKAGFACSDRPGDDDALHVLALEDSAFWTRRVQPGEPS